MNDVDPAVVADVLDAGAALLYQFAFVMLTMVIYMAVTPLVAIANIDRLRRWWQTATQPAATQDTHGR